MNRPTDHCRSRQIFQLVKVKRRGATAVEFAVAAPILFSLFFTAYEFSRVNMVRHTVDIAAYEGAREGILPGTSVDDVAARVNAVLEPAGMSGAVVTVTPDPIDRATREVTVQVVLPLDGNGWVLPRFVNGMQLTAESTLAREGYTSPDA